jgi:hypothetical protein
MSETQRDPSWWQASDGKWYPPQGVQPPFQPQQSSGPGCLKIGLIVLAVLAILGIGALVVFAVAVNEVVEEIDRRTGEADPANYEVQVEECAVDELGFPAAAGTIQNTSAEAHAFEVVVVFSEDGELLERSATLVDQLEPGQTGRWSTISTQEPRNDAVECEVQRVNYSIFGRD